MTLADEPGHRGSACTARDHARFGTPPVQIGYTPRHPTPPKRRPMSPKVPASQRAYLPPTPGAPCRCTAPSTPCTPIPTTHSPPPASHRSPAAVSVRCKKGSAATSASPNAVPAPDPPRTRPPRPRPRRLDQDSAQCHDSRPTRFRANEQDPPRHAAPGSLDLSRRLRRRTLRWPSDRAGPRPSTARQSRAQCRGSGRMAGLATSGELGCAPPRTALTDERQPGEYRVRTEGIAV